MFEVTISQAIMIYTSLPLAVLFILWFVFKIRADKNDNIKIDLKSYLHDCTYCGHSFLDVKKSKIVKCPMCKNLLKRGGIMAHG